MSDAFNAVAPTDQDHEHNTLRDPLRVVQEWELLDAHFDFDSSILLPSMSTELAELALLVRGNAGSPLSVFGHADPTGEIGYNKILAGRRALALFALLTRRVDLWQQLLSSPVGRDDWTKDARAARIMQGHLTGQAPAPGVPTKPLAELMPAYMAALGVDGNGAPFTVPPSAFLGQGADRGGKADVQGCGESNPQLMFSRLDTTRFANPAEFDARNEANAPNRRVTVFLFEKGTVVPPTKWPCPRVKEGIGGCRLRFWSDAAARGTPTETRRQFPADRTTFQCRFYDRLAISARSRPATRPLVLRLMNEKDEPDVAIPFTLTAEDVTVSGITDGDGVLRVKIPSTARSASLLVNEQTVEITITRLPSVTTIAGVQIRLRNLGFFDGAIDNATSLLLEDAVEAFQLDLDDAARPASITRNPRDPALQASLLREHGS